MRTAFDDMPNDLGASPSTSPTIVTDAMASQRLVSKTYTQACAKCAGRGRFISYSGRDLGACFLCSGSGKQTFKTAPEVRQRNREQARDRRAQELVDNLDRFAALYPDEFAWMKSKSGLFDFATNMIDAVRRYGELSVGQMSAVHRCMERDTERAEQRLKQADAAPVVDTSALQASFDKALASGLKHVRITIGGMVIKPAKASSANAGALYVTEGGTYLGKVMGGRFLKVRECDDAQAAQVAEFLNDPKAAAVAYGKRTGNCCICNRELTDPVSIANGIGPICADRFGW